MPIANAYELRQGLEDRGVKVEMIVYKGFGHPITKPRAMRAVMQHNLAWFNHYIWGDPLPDFANPDLPKKETSEAEKKGCGELRGAATPRLDSGLVRRRSEGHKCPL